MDAATLFLGLLWWLLGKGRAAPLPRQVEPPEAMPAPSSPPWPQVLPSDLPRFPGTAWEPDEPPPGVVQTRAGELLSQLWKGGRGTSKVEKTAGRWIAYQAEITRGSKRGVVAYRLRGAKRAAPTAPAPMRTPSAPALPRAATGPRTAPAPAPRAAPSSAPRAVPVTSPLGLPNLGYGMGLKPQAPLEDVKLLQRKLAIEPVDGRFGNDTKAAVKAFQRRNGLVEDGIVGPLTWTKLFAVRQ